MAGMAFNAVCKTLAAMGTRKLASHHFPLAPSTKSPLPIRTDTRITTQLLASTYAGWMIGDIRAATCLVKQTVLMSNDNAITDAGLASLEELSGLERLSVARTRVTNAGIEKLRRALSKVTIIR